MSYYFSDVTALERAVAFFGVAFLRRCSKLLEPIGDRDFEIHATRHAAVERKAALFGFRECESCQRSVCRKNNPGEIEGSRARVRRLARKRKAQQRILFRGLDIDPEPREPQVSSSQLADV